MVQRITNFIKGYQDTVRELPCVPTTSFRRDSLGYSGDANKLFLTFLFSDRNIGIQFLNDVGLILSKVQCNSCGRHMTWYAHPSDLHGFIPATTDYLVPLRSGISLHRYASAVIRRCVTDAMFSSSSQNTHIALARMTAPLAAIFGPLFSSRSEITFPYMIV